MKIYCDWVVKNEEKRIRQSLESLLPYIDAAVVIDTGSTDGTLEIVKELRKKYPHLLPTRHVDIGPNFNISLARNLGLRVTPVDFWTTEVTWYAAIAGDEVYDESAKNLRSTLEGLPDETRWVYTWCRDWHINEEGDMFIKKTRQERPIFYRHQHLMEWQGVWNRERVVYLDIGSYFAFERRKDRKRLYWDADLWYDHYGWADDKREYRQRKYNELAELERKGVIPHPRA